MVCTLASGRISEKIFAICFLAKITSTGFTWKTIRCNFCGQNKKWWEGFPMHEIVRIDGGKVFLIGRNMIRIGGNKFHDRKNEIPMKILDVKRSGIGILVEFCGITTRFPNQGLLRGALEIVVYAPMEVGNSPVSRNLPLLVTATRGLKFPNQ
jgi:hypothetical protein